ncbi:hypothetical protein AAFF39_01615 [Lactococcus garvieae]
MKELCYLIEKYLREWEENGQLFRYGGDEFLLSLEIEVGMRFRKL